MFPSDAKSERNRKRMAWVLYALAAVIGVGTPLTVSRTNAADYLQWREWLLPFAVGVTLFGVGITLVVARAKIARAYHSRTRLNWATLALAGVLVSCGAGWVIMDDLPHDSRPVVSRDARSIKAALGRMPGVHEVSIDHFSAFSTVVVLTDEASPEQAKAVVQTFHDQISDRYRYPWQVDIELRRRDGNGSFKAGKAGLASAPDRAARWLVLRDAFPAGEVKWTSHTWISYYYGSSDNRRKGDAGIGDISLKLLHTNDFNAVTETYRRLTQDSPELAQARWQISTSDPDGGSLGSANRYPTEFELGVWTRLNEDQTIRHIVVMNSVINVDVRVRLESDAGAVQLSEQHRPILAELGTKVRYTVGKEVRDGHSSFAPQTLQITIGG